MGAAVKREPLSLSFAEEDKKGSSGDAGGTKDEEDEEDEEEEQLLLLQRPGKASPGSRKVKNGGQKSLLIDLKDTKVKAKVESWVIIVYIYVHVCTFFFLYFFRSFVRYI